MKRKKVRGKSNPRIQPKPQKRVIIDSFSLPEVQLTNRYWEERRNFERKFYYELARQRGEIESELLSSLSSSTITKLELDTGFHRAIDARWGNEPLSVIGSIKKPPGGRFNVFPHSPALLEPFPALYLGNSRHTCLSEFFQITSQDPEKGLSQNELALRPEVGVTVLGVSLRLERVLDLRAPDSLEDFANATNIIKIPKYLLDEAKKLDLKYPSMIRSSKDILENILKDNWRGHVLRSGVPANSQVIGALLLKGNYQGVIYPSVRSDGECLAVYPQNFINTDSFVKVSSALPETARLTLLNAKVWTNHFEEVRNAMRGGAVDMGLH
jgi:RES domain-containing protein